MKHFNIEICNLCMLLNYKFKQDHIIKFGIIKKKTEDSFTIGAVFKATTYSGRPLSPGWKLWSSHTLEMERCVRKRMANSEL